MSIIILLFYHLGQMIIIKINEILWDKKGIRQPEADYNKE